MPLLALNLQPWISTTEVGAGGALCCANALVAAKTAVASRIAVRTRIFFMTVSPEVSLLKSKWKLRTASAGGSSKTEDGASSDETLREGLPNSLLFGTAWTARRNGLQERGGECASPTRLASQRLCREPARRPVGVARV